MLLFWGKGNVFVFLRLDWLIFCSSPFVFPERTSIIWLRYSSRACKNWEIFFSYTWCVLVCLVQIQFCLLEFCVFNGRLECEKFIWLDNCEYDCFCWLRLFWGGKLVCCCCCSFFDNNLLRIILSCCCMRGLIETMFTSMVFVFFFQFSTFFGGRGVMICEVNK